MTLTDSQTLEALDLTESSVSLVEGAEGPVAADGTIQLHVIRPGLGRGRGKHLYEARMLEANAHKFGKHTGPDGEDRPGWRMFINHLSPEAKKAQGGLPRDVQDLGGRIIESWWDPNVPASGRHGQGAVVARAKPTKFMRDLIDDDPEIVEASICATATGVKPGNHAGERCWIVEGIEDRGSVDWVTEAGAGGKVVAIMEAAYADDADGKLALLDTISDSEITAHLLDQRPALAEALAEASSKSDEESAAGESGESASAEGEEDAKRKSLIAKWMKKGMSRAVAEKMADRALSKMQESPEDEDMRITPESLREALQEDDARQAIVEALDLGDVIAHTVHEYVQEALVEHLPGLVESAMESERDFVRATAAADADRRIQVERMRRQAHEMVEATTLPARWKEDLKAKFDITESGVTAPLDQIDDIDDEGNVKAKAEDKLTEAVNAEITHARDLVAAANPTRVRGLGGSAPDDTDDSAAKPSKSPSGGLTESLLQEAGFADAEKVYDADRALQG